VAIRIGTRSSELARWQANEVARLMRAQDPARDIRLVELTTAGDELADLPLDRMEGTGFFTSTLERALLDRQIDIAVHSYKDLPVVSTPGLVVAAVPARGPVEDALCATGGAKLADLGRGARVGTSSLRRIAQVRALRPDLSLEPLRGNVPTRLDRVRRSDLDAVVVALAGIARLGLLGHVTEIFPTRDLLPAPAQGALAIQVREDDATLGRSLAALDDHAVRLAVEAERAVLHALRGGCSVPVGASARSAGDRVVLEAGVFSPRGDRALRIRVEGDEPAAVGREAAQRLLGLGAGEILADLERRPLVAWGAPR
jgi:hydroxymethylbilane synthase